MQTPGFASMAEFFESVKDFLDKRCILNRDEIYCADCGSRISYSNVGLSIREEGFSGPTDSEIWSVSLPYCPICEPTPKRNGRLHSASGTRPN